MFPTVNQVTVSQRLLAEIAASGLFPNPTFFVYGVLTMLTLVCIATGYLTTRTLAASSSELSRSLGEERER